MTKTDARCINCKFLGECSIVDLAMLAKDQVCAEWERAAQPVIEAREEAREMAGSQALKAMLLNDPPKKPAKSRR